MCNDCMTVYWMLVLYTKLENSTVIYTVYDCNTRKSDSPAKAVGFAQYCGVTNRNFCTVLCV